MRICKVCGGEIDADTIICPHCGCAVPKEAGAEPPSMALSILSFLFPIVGLVLYCIHYRKDAKRAQRYATCALAGCILTGLLGYVISNFFLK